MHSSETDPVGAARSGDAAAAAMLVDSHWSAVFRLVYRLSGNAHDAEDLCQETFLRALDRLDSFQIGTNFRAWLRRIAVNAFLNLRKKRQTAGETSIDGDFAAPPRRPEQASEDAEIGAQAARALAELPETARVVFVLRVQEELSFTTIAEMMGFSEETARWHHHQARKQLMSRMTPHL